MIKYKEPIIVAEIGCNHMGQLDIAYELVDLAKESGANYAKFQKRNRRRQTDRLTLAGNPDAAPHVNNKDRGHLSVGMPADVIVYDLKNLRITPEEVAFENATSEPKSLPGFQQLPRS